jgi:hypothetical protein
MLQVGGEECAKALRQKGVCYVAGGTRPSVTVPEQGRRKSQG